MIANRRLLERLAVVQDDSPNVIEKIGIMIYFICTLEYKRDKIVRKTVRNTISSLNDQMHALTLAPKKKKKAQKGSSLAECIIGMNSLFSLIFQIQSETELLLYAPVICEYVLSEYSSEDIREDLIYTLSILVFNDPPEEIFIGIVYTLVYLLENGYVLKKVPEKRVKELKETEIHRILQIQEKIKGAKELFSSLGGIFQLPKQFSGHKQSIQSTEGKEVSETNDVNKFSVQSRVFLRTLKEALLKRTLGLIDREKEIEITKTVFFYERLALSKGPAEIPFDLILSSIVWSNNPHEFKQASQMYIDKQVTEVPLFVIAYLGWVLVKGTSEAKYAKNISQLARKLSVHYGNLLLKSCFFFIYYLDEIDKTNINWSVIKDILSGYIAVDNLPALSILYTEYPWALSIPEIVQEHLSTTIEEYRSFFITQLIKHQEISVIFKNHLEQEVYSLITKLLENTPNDRYLISLLSQLNHSCTKTFNEHDTQIEIPQITPLTTIEYIQQTLKQNTNDNTTSKEILEVALSTELPDELIDTLITLILDLDQTHIPNTCIYILYLSAILNRPLNTLIALSNRMITILSSN
ncbi:hypothetical protein NEOKW01_1061 [Nematocida sp. AWRm80]|nr:hypothetical protein NEOKW01_1061 [Nematocida sp. AWRm80]